MFQFPPIPSNLRAAIVVNGTLSTMPDWQLCTDDESERRRNGCWPSLNNCGFDWISSTARNTTISVNPRPFISPSFPPSFILTQVIRLSTAQRILGVPWYVNGCDHTKPGAQQWL